MKNTISERVFDFLKNYPPFNLLTAKKIAEIASEVKIIYLEKGKILFNQNDTNHEHFYIVRNGGISMYKNSENDKSLIDICDAGDIFGLRPLISKENYLLDAIANEESIVYGIPIAIFEAVSEKSLKINKYLLTSFASTSFDPYTSEQNNNIFTDYIAKDNLSDSNLQSINYTKRPLKCTIKSTIKEAAIKMSAQKIGCIVVVDDECVPIGIITNSDIKNKIATGLFSIDTSVKEIMSFPVITQSKNLTVLDAQLQMIKHRVGHVCITADGTGNSKLIGILTNHDVLASLGNNPTVILKEIKRAKRTREIREIRSKANLLLKSYLEQNIPLSHISKIISEVNDSVTIRVIELSLKKMETPPPVKFTWLALGSQGRKEQLLYTDQDNALIFEDVEQEKYQETKEYFLKLAGHITKSLHKIGYEYCPAEMMASNPEWCLSLSEWKNQFNDWIMNIDEKAILLSSIFFDFNAIYGDTIMPKELTKSIFESLNNKNLLCTFLAKEAVASPSPLGFFKQFLVENNGDHKDFFNIKKRALMPLINAARLLVLSNNISEINNTAQRFERLAEIEPQNKELYQSCSYAFKAVLKFKTKQGILHNNSGRIIQLESLTKEEKLKLKRCFKPIREIQEVLSVRYNLANLR
jgi:CBS domain-containing protein